MVAVRPSRMRLSARVSVSRASWDCRRRAFEFGLWTFTLSIRAFMITPVAATISSRHPPICTFTAAIPRGPDMPKEAAKQELQPLVIRLPVEMHEELKHRR
jgi:hypothetical protein